MISMLSNIQNVILQHDKTILFSSLLFGSVVATIIIVLTSSLSYFKCFLKKFIRIQLRKRLMNPLVEASDKGLFVSYYRNYLCNLQKINNEQLGKILQKNYSSAFFVDRSISFLNSHRPLSPRLKDEGYVSIDEFRNNVPLTTYDDYQSYIDRIVAGGEKNLLSSEQVIYLNISSGTTAKNKFIPMTKVMMNKLLTLIHIGHSVIWRSLPHSLFPSAEQRFFQLQSGKKANLFTRSKDGIPIGSLSQSKSAILHDPRMRTRLSLLNVISLDLIEGIADFETNAFVQVVFALAIPDLYSYSIMFAPSFIHTVKIIENYFEEISLCISSANFDHSSLVRNNIHDIKLRIDLNQALNELTIEYGDVAYRLERAKYIRKECRTKDVPGILHRLWPNLIYASTATGSTFAMFKEEMQFYCGDKLPLINAPVYAASEEYFGILASIHTDEYFLLPTSVFFEFIKEEDVHQIQPKTLLISEIEPGNRYELVCTTEAGFIRYRMGDIINCTRFLTRADDLVPLPSEPAEIPRIPLISIAYRIGNLLDIYGEKTTEQHVMNALKQTVHQWHEQGIFVDISNFTSYPKFDAFPANYVIFLELIDNKNHVQDRKIDEQQLQNNASSEIDRQLCIVNPIYKDARITGRLGSLRCIFVRSGTFATFLNKELVIDRISPIQIKPRRLLNNEQHIQFFYDHQITTS